MELIMDYTYDPSAYSTELSYTDTAMSVDTDGAMAMFGVIVVIGLIFTIGFYVLNSIFLGKIFKKAGVESWKAWVPILNSWKMLEIGGKPGFWAILAIIPIVNLVAAIFMYIAIHNINLKIQYGVGMTILAIFFPMIWVIVAGVNKNPWNDSLGDPRTDQPQYQPAGPAYAQQPPAPEYAQPAAPGYAQPPAPTAPVAPAPGFAQPPAPTPVAPAPDYAQPPVPEQPVTPAASEQIPVDNPMSMEAPTAASDSQEQDNSQQNQG